VNVHLPAVGTDATETAAGPGFADGGDEEFLAAAVRVEESLVGRGETEGLLGGSGEGEQKECSKCPNSKFQRRSKFSMCVDVGSRGRSPHRVKLLQTVT